MPYHELLTRPGLTPLFANRCFGSWCFHRLVRECVPIRNDTLNCILCLLCELGANETSFVTSFSVRKQLPPASCWEVAPRTQQCTAEGCRRHMWQRWLDVGQCMTLQELQDAPVGSPVSFLRSPRCCLARGPVGMPKMISESTCCIQLGSLFFPILSCCLCSFLKHRCPDRILPCVVLSLGQSFVD